MVVMWWWGKAGNVTHMIPKRTFGVTLVIPKSLLGVKNRGWLGEVYLLLCCPHLMISHMEKRIDAAREPMHFPTSFLFLSFPKCSGVARPDLIVCEQSKLSTCGGISPICYPFY